MNRPSLKLTIAALGTAFLGACNAPPPGPDPMAKIYDNMLDQPDGSYSLMVDGKLPQDGGTSASGPSLLVIKQNNSRNDNVTDAAGTQGSQHCANFRTVSVTLESDSYLHPSYTGYCGRGGCSTTAGAALTTLDKDTLLNIPNENKGSRLDASRKLYCRFTPKTQPLNVIAP